MRLARSTVLCSLVAFAAGAGVMWAQQQAASRREPQFENDQLKVWKSIVMPNQPLTFHRHDHGRAIIALTDGTLNMVGKDGKILDSYNLVKGTAIYRGIDPPGRMHADVNPSTKPVEVIVVELKNDTKHH
ncbi:MAG: hypothetical protein ACREPM_16125 [Gemmatimonadaceae bacterium]